MVAISCFLTLGFAYQHINVLGFEPAHDSVCLCGFSMFLQLHFRKKKKCLEELPPTWLKKTKTKKNADEPEKPQSKKDG